MRAALASTGAGLGGAAVGLILGILFGVLWSETESDQPGRPNPHGARPGMAGSLAVGLLLFASIIGLGVAVITKKALIIGAAAAVFLVSLLAL
jgi:Na+/proline symporter